MLHSAIKRATAVATATPCRQLLSVLALTSAAGMTLLIFRAAYGGRMGYVSLPWDLFLAWVPIPLALAVDRLQRRDRVPYASLLLLASLWLLFFPNAPYLVTQFTHLHPNHAVHDGFHPLAAWSPRGH